MKIDSVISLLCVVMFGMVMFISGVVMAKTNHNTERICNASL